MRFDKTYVPYGAYWSTPFAKWQGSRAHLHAVRLAADVARNALAERQVPADRLDQVVLGTTVPQRHAMYGSPFRWSRAAPGQP